MMPRHYHYLLCVLAGLCFAAAQAPIGFWPLLFVGFGLSLWLLKASKTARRAGWSGWVIAASYFGTSLSWIVEPFLVDFAATGWMAPFALLGLAGGLALFWALPFWCAARLGCLSSIVALWPLAEYARSTIFTGFPWGLHAYALVDTPFAQIAAWVGPHGLGALALAFISLAFFWKLRLGSIAALVGLAGLAALGFMRLDNTPVASQDAPVIRLVQPNAPQHQKWDPAYSPIFFRRALLATEAKPKPALIVWPETSLPSWLNESDRTIEAIAQAANGLPVLVGAQRYEGQRAWNSLALINGTGALGQIYDKHHLVPFGEYLPFARFLNRIGLRAFTETVSGFAPGSGPELMDLGDIGTALPLICYEAVFPHEMQTSQGRPDFLLHVTNDAWFGTWSGPYQHLVQAQFRAIEQGLPLLRSANTGITASIDAHGRILENLALGETGYLDATLPPPSRATLYARFGDLPALLCLLMLFCATLAPYRGRTH